MQHQTHQMAMEMHAHANMAGLLMTSLLMSELSLCVCPVSLPSVPQFHLPFLLREIERREGL